MPKIPIEKQNEKKEFSRKEIITPEKAETLKNLYQNKEFATIQKPPKVSSKIIILSIIISVIFGLLAGFFGALYLLTRKEIKIPLFKKINLEEILPKREITLFTEKKITVVPEERVLEVVDKVSSQLVKVFFSKKIKKGEILSGLILPEENLGLAVILTSDGWLLTTKDIINRKDLVLEILTSEKKRFPVKKIVFDDLAGVVFLKIEGKDLPVVKFADQESQILGKNLLVFNKFSDLDLVQISQPRFSPIKEKKDFIKSTEKFSDFLKINKELNESFHGSPVFDLEGSFLGFVQQKNQIIPLSHFRSIFESVFKNEKIRRPFFGLEYIELEDILVSSSDLEKVKNGVFVYTLKEKSPAFLAGLKNSDLILKVNEITLDEKKNLTEIIQEHKPNQEIEFLILREGKEIILKAKLDSLKF